MEELEKLDETSNTNSFRANFNRLSRLLVTKTYPRKQVLINGLIGVALGAYSLNDKRITQLTDEIVEKYLDLL